jgi:hypothetical protein
LTLRPEVSGNQQCKDKKNLDIIQIKIKKNMKFLDFEHIMSQKRMERYVKACGGDTRKAMTLYRYNLQISQEMFTIISCFEVALRNAIDRCLATKFGEEWLRTSIMPNGFLTNKNTVKTYNIIKQTYDKLVREGSYSHSKLLSGLEFGIWKYMYSPVQFRATKQILLQVFPNKLRSTPELHINQTYIFNELDKINTLRNRIAHHEPICFPTGKSIIYTSYIINEYHKIQTLFSWMGIDSRAMLYGLDHVLLVCRKIDELK